MNLNLLKATRIHRTLTGLTAVMVSVAFTNSIILEIIIFCLCCVLLYSAAGIHNAKKDEDYKLPKYTNGVIYLVLFLTLILASINKIILFGIMIQAILAAVYNLYSRYVLLGDVTILSIAHVGWPIFISSIILDLDFITGLKLGAWMAVTTWFIIHIKNLKDKKGDLKRGYMTLVTVFENGTAITLFLFQISFISMFLGYLFFNLGSNYLIFIIILFVLKERIVGLVNNNDEKKALRHIRLFVMLYLFSFIIEKTSSMKILMISITPFIIYMTSLLRNSNLFSFNILINKFRRNMNEYTFH